MVILIWIRKRGTGICSVLGWYNEDFSSSGCPNSTIRSITCSNMGGVAFDEEMGPRTGVGGGIILLATIMYLTLKERRVVASTA